MHNISMTNLYSFSMVCGENKALDLDQESTKMLDFWISFFIFIMSHSVITRLGVRAYLVKKWGEKPYLTAYSIVSIFLLGWLIVNAQNAPRTQLWPWLIDLYWAPNLVMPFACVLLISGFVVPNALSIAARAEEFNPEQLSFTVALTRHPILWAFFLWSTSHIIPNGEYPLIVMFGGFAIFSVLGLLIVDKKRKREMGIKTWKVAAKNTHAIIFCAPSLWTGHWRFTKYDGLGIIGGVLFYLLLYGLHGYLFGIDPRPPL